jgi:heme exporter protein A
MVAACELRGIHRRFGRYWALVDISLQIQPGEAVLVCGPNGAGKSTLLSICATLLRPTHGELLLFGKEPRRHRTEVRAKMGYLLHQTLLDDALTAEENLRFYAALYGLDQVDTRVKKRLEEAGLAHRAKDTVQTFSRGMRQRLSLARALLHEPDLLLLDEPLTGLDQQAKDALCERLALERQAGRALIIVSHELPQLMGFSDRVVRIDGGRMVEDKRVAETIA